tara:strand:+ start:1112 stop:1996 length:885 start_codon:yes stop_codon:yes gene_type:complete
MPDKTPTTQILYETCDTSNLKDVVTTTDIKLWKRNQNKLRDNIIGCVEDEGIALPHYHLTLVYYNKYDSTDEIKKQHRFIRNQIEEIFNPRYRNQSDKQSLFFFCERHKSYLTNTLGKKFYLFNQVQLNNEVKNTITNNVDYDYIDSEIRLGAYHSHILKSKIPDSILTKPSRKLRDLMRETLGFYEIPDGNITTAELNFYKLQLLEGVCRRSEIVGNGKASIKITEASEDKYYDGYYGWKGLISYTTKRCYNAYMMIDTIDNDNSSLSLSPVRKPIKDSIKRKVKPIDNEVKP